MVERSSTEGMINTQEYRISASLGQLYGVLSMPGGEGPFSLVILCHGFGVNMAGNQDYADHFLAQGFAVFNFDFCGGGYGSRSEGSMLEMSVLTEKADLNAVLDTFDSDPRFSSIFLWGASQGGFVASCVAAERQEDVRALVLEFPAYVIHDYVKKFVLPDGSFPDTYKVLGIPVGPVYGEDALSFDICDMLGNFPGNVLILHGDRDTVVPISYAERATEIFPSAKLTVMPDQSHGFTGQARSEAKEKESAFLKKETEKT